MVHPGLHFVLRHLMLIVPYCTEPFLLSAPHSDYNHLSLPVSLCSPAMRGPLFSGLVGGGSLIAALRSMNCFTQLCVYCW